MIYPHSSTAPMPHADLPEAVKGDFIEARNVLNLSPRAATALLRVCVETLARELLGDESTKELNKDIGKLVANGMPETIRQAMDTVRVVGSAAVHPGVLDKQDTAETATKLFELINIITEVMISQPAAIAALYDEKVSEPKKEQIDKRDNKEN